MQTSFQYLFKQKKGSPDGKPFNYVWLHNTTGLPEKASSMMVMIMCSYFHLRHKD